tara:strand:- start:30004 stop:30510 length:507 start_codon:yes stop_codon:yes gene_type:complete
MSKTTSTATWTNELAKQWDAARSQLKSATDAIATANKALAALATDASAEQRQAAEKAVADAKATVVTAQAVITELSKGPKPPKATKSTGAAPKTNTPPVKPATGEGSNSAALAAQSGATKDEKLVAAIANHGVRWNGRTFEQGEVIEPLLPQSVFDTLLADGAVHPAD